MATGNPTVLLPNLPVVILGYSTVTEWSSTRVTTALYISKWGSIDCHSSVVTATQVNTNFGSGKSCPKFSFHDFFPKIRGSVLIFTKKVIFVDQFGSVPIFDRPGVRPPSPSV